MKNNMNWYLVSGMLLWLINMILVRFCGLEILDIIQYPWMIVSCILMIIGLFKVGKQTREKH